MPTRWRRVSEVWRRTLSLSWPVMTEQLFNTLMRTTDVVVTALFSPAAVAAVGLADLYAQFPLRLGLGLGGGAMALSSQDTGGGARSDRDEAITQALALGALLGLPVVVFGLALSEWAIAVLGADPETVALGGLYLGVVLLSAPMRIVGVVGSRALQGTGDTRTPMYVNITASLVNIVASVALGLGVFAPRLGVVGVAVGTALGNTVTATGVVIAIYSPGTEAGYARPRSPVIAKQLVVVSVPRVAEGLATTLVYFPFNALLLGFGTTVNAGFQIGRRMYHQVAGPLYRAYNTTASIVVGQALGAGDPGGARFDGFAHAALAALTMLAAGIVLFVAADDLVRLLTDDAATTTYAVNFARAYAVALPCIGLCFSFSGSLQGASETRIPFVGRATGLFAFFFGFSALVGGAMGYGVVGAYAGIVLTYVWWGLLVTGSFVRGGWAARASAMIESRRGDASEDGASS